MANRRFARHCFFFFIAHETSSLNDQELLRTFLCADHVFRAKHTHQISTLGSRVANAVVSAALKQDWRDSGRIRIIVPCGPHKI